MIFLDHVGRGRLACCSYCCQYSRDSCGEILHLQGSFQIIICHDSCPSNRASSISGHSLHPHQRDTRIDSPIILGDSRIVCVCRAVGLAVVQHRLPFMEKETRSSRFLYHCNVVMRGGFFRVTWKGIGLSNFEHSQSADCGNTYVRIHIFYMQT